MRRDDTSPSHPLAHRIDPAAFAHELVPLNLATRLVSARAYGSDAHSSENRLAGIAHVMAALVPIYVYALDGSDVRLMTDEELRTGFFRKDGGELYFIDGRAPLTCIAVRHDAIGEVTRLLASAVDGEDGARELLRTGNLA